MASTYKLVTNYSDENGKSVTLSYNYAQSEPSTTAVKALMQAVITNGSIFKQPPVKIVGAQIVETTKTAIDLS